MLGIASELRSEIVDARVLNSWFANSPNVVVIQIQFSMAGISETGILPHALIIYKEE